MFCNKCGNKMRDDAAFCAKCGNKISTAEPAKQTHEGVTAKSNNDKQTARYVPTETKKKSAAIRNIGIAAAALIIVVCGFFAWRTVGSDGGSSAAERTRIGGDVLSSRVIRQVNPIYPQTARTDRVSGLKHTFQPRQIRIVRKGFKPPFQYFPGSSDIA